MLEHRAECPTRDEEAAGRAAAGREQKDLAREPKVWCPVQVATEADRQSQAMKATRTMAVSKTVMATKMVQVLAPSPWMGSDPLAHLAPFQRLRVCLPWWQKHAPQFVLNLIREGVEPQFQGTHLHLRPQKKDNREVELALEVMQEYVEAKAAKEVPFQGTRYLVPWFVIQKVEPDGKIKNRLISDCRQINQVLTPPKFRLDHWRDIFPLLEKACGPQKWS